MNMKRLLCVAAGLLLSFSSMHAVIQETVMLEETYTHRLQSALDAMNGPGNIVVRVNILLSEPRYEVRHTGQSNVKTTKASNQYEILPGYPVIKNLANPTTPFDSVTTVTKPKIQKVIVSLIVRKGFPTGKVARSSQAIPKIINVPANIVTIETETQEFAEEADKSQNISITNEKQSLVTVENFFYIAVLILLFLFFRIYQESQELNRTAMAAAAAKSGTGGSAGGGGVQHVITTHKGRPESGGGRATSSHASMKRYFDFVTEENLENFVYILKKENMSIENIAVITSFLSPELGSKVVLTLDLNQQATVALNMLNQKSVNRQNIEKLESHIKNALECLVGGQVHFQKTFNLVPGDLKKKLLLILGKASPEGYKNFRKNIILFDDIKLLTEEELKILANDISMEILSKAFSGSDKQLLQRFLESMPITARDLFRQTVELKGKSLTSKEIEEAQDIVLKTIVELETDSMFNLQQRIKV